MRSYLETLDPAHPYYITDNMMFSCERRHKGEHIPLDETAYCVLPNVTPANITGKPGCPRNPAVLPCTPAAIRAARDCRVPPEERGKDVGWHFPIGNSGAVLSRGLLHRIPYEQWHTCERNAGHPYGDVAIGNCIWEAGYGPTVPTDIADEAQFSRCVFGRVSAEDYARMARAAGPDSWRLPPGAHVSSFDVLRTAVSTWVRHHNTTENAAVISEFWEARQEFMDRPIVDFLHHRPRREEQQRRRR
jgi:hypothetical protein